MLQGYYDEREKRKKDGLPSVPLSAQEVQEIANAFENSSGNAELLNLIENEVSPGVDEAAYVKAAFLKDLALEKTKTDLIAPQKSIEILGTMLGGYSVEALVEILKKDKFAAEAAEALKNTILVYDSFNEIFELSKNNSHAKSIIDSWANAEWFENKPTLDEEIKLTIYKVSGETNTDDFSPAKEAWSRPDIPLHAEAFLKFSENIDNPLDELKKFDYFERSELIKIWLDKQFFSTPNESQMKEIEKSFFQSRQESNPVIKFQREDAQRLGVILTKTNNYLIAEEINE